MRATPLFLAGCLALLWSVSAPAQETKTTGGSVAAQSAAWESRLRDSGWTVQGPSRAIPTPQQPEPARWLTAQYGKGALYLVLVDLQCSASLILDATVKEKLKAPVEAEPVTRRLGSNLSAELRQSRPYAEVLAYVAAAMGSDAAGVEKAVREWIGSIDWAALPVVNDDEHRAEEFRPVPGLPSIRILAKRSTVSITGERYGLAAVEIRTLER